MSVFMRRHIRGYLSTLVFVCSTKERKFLKGELKFDENSQVRAVGDMNGDGITDIGTYKCVH